MRLPATNNVSSNQLYNRDSDIPVSASSDSPNQSDDSTFSDYDSNSSVQASREEQDTRLKVLATAAERKRRFIDIEGGTELQPSKRVGEKQGGK